MGSSRPTHAKLGFGGHCWNNNPNRTIRDYQNAG